MVLFDNKYINVVCTVPPVVSLLQSDTLWTASRVLLASSHPTRRSRTLQESSLCSEMAAELRFAMRCRGTTKPARKKGPAGSTEEGRFMPLGPYAQYGFMGKEPLA